MKKTQFQRGTKKKKKTHEDRGVGQLSSARLQDKPDENAEEANDLKQRRMKLQPVVRSAGLAHLAIIKRLLA